MAEARERVLSNYTAGAYVSAIVFGKHFWLTQNIIFHDILQFDP